MHTPPTPTPQLERWGRGEEPSPHLLQRLPDGYWTPWHIADAELAALRAECERLKKDAARYQWLRPRMQVRKERAVNGGDLRATLNVRIGQAFFDTPTRGSKGYILASDFDTECRILDAEVDAALTPTERTP